LEVEYEDRLGTYGMCAAALETFMSVAAGAASARGRKALRMVRAPRTFTSWVRHQSVMLASAMLDRVAE
jgi:hypothetical protein